MKTATITETKNHLSALIHEVQRGETVIVLDRKKPVARIESVAPLADEDDRARIERLQRSGVLVGRREDGVTEILAGRPFPLRGSASAVQALRAEREDGR